MNAVRASVLPLTILTAVALATARPARAQCTPFEFQKLLASDGATSDKFGFAVDFDGQHAVVTSLQHSHAASCAGSVYVFGKAGLVWKEQAELLAADTGLGNWYGSAVDLDGDRILVGARQDDDLGGNSGSAYVWVRQGGVWVEEQKLTASDGQPADQFGYRVMLDGDTAAIAATGVVNRTGAVYMFERISGVWTETQKLMASDGAALDGFGWSVALENDTLAVGSIGDDDQGDRAGSVYIFNRSGGAWSEDLKIYASDADVSDNFGVSMAMESGTLLIGAPSNNDAGADSGSAYVFTGAGKVWTEVQKLTASDAVQNAQFGEDVALDGNTAVVGAWNDTTTFSATGSAYVYTRVGDTWVEWTKLLATDRQQSDNLGGSVAVANGIVLVGAQNTDALGNNSGSAYIFEAMPAGWTEYGQGWPGTGGVPDLSLGSAPVIGQPLSITIDNSRGVTTDAQMVVGFSKASIPLGAGGTLLVVPFVLSNLVLPPGGLMLNSTVPNDPGLCGLELFLQVLERDPGASGGVSFSAGLELDLGG